VAVAYSRSVREAVGYRGALAVGGVDEGCESVEDPFLLSFCYYFSFPYSILYVFSNST
jgi:hypothetical protein